MSIVVVDVEDDQCFVDGNGQPYPYVSAVQVAERSARGLEGFAYVGKERSASIVHTPKGWETSPVSWGRQTKTPPARALYPFLAMAQSAVMAWITDKKPIAVVSKKGAKSGS